MASSIGWTQSREHSTDYAACCPTATRISWCFPPSKFNFARKEVSSHFTCFMNTEKSIKPAHKYTESIRSFPTPKNISEVKSWYGLVNQVTYCFCKDVPDSCESFPKGNMCVPDFYCPNEAISKQSRIKTRVPHFCSFPL